MLSLFFISYEGWSAEPPLTPLFSIQTRRIDIQKPQLKLKHLQNHHTEVRIRGSNCICGI